LTIIDGVVPLQADGDRIGSSAAWSFGIEPAAIRIIGRWRG
jgi:hypothetical protein